jgi:hypothetical protein
MLKHMENHPLVNTAIRSLLSSEANVRDVQILKNVMAHQLRANNASKNVPLTDMMKIKKYLTLIFV